MALINLVSTGDSVYNNTLYLTDLMYNMRLPAKSKNNFYQIMNIERFLY
jgi:hypothetical protein